MNNPTLEAQFAYQCWQASRDAVNRIISDVEDVSATPELTELINAVIDEECFWQDRLNALGYTTTADGLVYPAIESKTQ